MQKPKINRNTILDKLHRGFVYTCIGVTLYGTFLLGRRIHHYLTVVKPARQQEELKMLQEGAAPVDKAKELKY